MNVTAVFDIGKTNKKFFLFDKDFQVLHQEYTRFDEIADEDGYPCEDLPRLTQWMKRVLNTACKHKAFKVNAVNVSTYGASLVHIDRLGNPVSNLYNYTKPLPEEILDQFLSHYGPSSTLAAETGSPLAGMLNSGLQLYWLKHTRPESYKRVRYSLHLPQYLSYLFTGIPVSEYTSIGCHTALWHYGNNDYHDWVYAEKIDLLFPPVVSARTSINVPYMGRSVRFGVGIHDSSAALLPYLWADTEPFLLLSTGTWSVSLNPFSHLTLTEADLEKDTLHYMQIDGKPVRATRLYLGNEYDLQVQKLLAHFGMETNAERPVRFKESVYLSQMADPVPKFHFENISAHRTQPPLTRYDSFADFETGYHRLLIELMEVQIESSKGSIGQTAIKKIYVDGGFSGNELFIKLLQLGFPDHSLHTTSSPIGSALGAAWVISEKRPGYEPFHS